MRGWGFKNGMYTTVHIMQHRVKQMLMYIYTSIIHSKIDYALSVWGYTTAHNITKVQRLHNRTAKRAALKNSILLNCVYPV